VYKPRDIAYPDLFLFFTVVTLLSTTQISSHVVNSGVFRTLNIPSQAAKLFNALSDVRKFNDNYIYDGAEAPRYLDNLVAEIECELSRTNYEETVLHKSDSLAKYLFTDKQVLDFQLKNVCRMLNDIRSAHSEMNKADIMLNILAKAVGRLPSSKRETVPVAALERSFDPNQIKTRIKGARKYY
jgi:phage terminase Nu1 subunit (DNA packaging protein)